MKRLGLAIGCAVVLSASLVPLATGGSTKASCNGRVIDGLCTPPPVPGHVRVYALSHVNSYGANVTRLALWPNHTSRRTVTFEVAMRTPPPTYAFEINHQQGAAAGMLTVNFRRPGKYKARILDRSNGKTIHVYYSPQSNSVDLQATFTVR